jgi:hypothetical protein
MHSIVRACSQFLPTEAIANGLPAKHSTIKKKYCYLLLLITINPIPGENWMANMEPEKILAK